MIVSTAQPYFAPYPGFFAKASRCDVLVLLDTVQFPQRTTWMTRNRFKHEQGTLWMTIPVMRKGRGCQRINEVRICREGSWAKKHLKSLKSSYGRAPFFDDHLVFLEDLFTGEEESLVNFNLGIIRYLMRHLGIEARTILLSELSVRAREPELTMKICSALKAGIFLAQRPAAKFIDREALERSGVKTRFFAPHPAVYPQLYGPFIANLSTFDLLFTCGPRAPGIVRESVFRDG